MGKENDQRNKEAYTSMRTCNILVSAVSLILGALILSQSWKLGIGASQRYGIKSGTWPGIMGMGIILFALILLGYTIKNAQKLADLDCTDAHGDYLYRVSIHLWENFQVYKVTGMIVAYAVIMRYLGFYLASLILLPILMWFMMPEEEGKDRKKAFRILLVDVCTVFAIYLIFERLLGTALPRPLWR